MPADPLRSLLKTKAAFVEPMDCLPVAKLPEGPQWLWEIKLDGYRAVAPVGPLMTFVGIM
jgi:ATP-dependent DNA ligase